MALIGHQTQGSCLTSSFGPKLWTKGIKLRSFVAFRLVDRTKKCIPLRHRFSLRDQPVNLSKGRHFQVLSFKGNAQNDESNCSASASSSKLTKPPVQLSCTQEEREEIVAESPEMQTHPIHCATEDREDTIAGSLAIQKLFRKWLLILRTQASSQTVEVQNERPVQGETPEGQRALSRTEAGKLLKSAVVYFMRLDAAISLPLLIFIPFYLTVRVVYGAEVTKELTPMWVLGPLIVALYVKIVQGLFSLYLFCFMTALRLAKNLPSYCLLVYNYIAEGKLKAFLWTHFLKPVEDVKNLDYKELFLRKMKQLQEWAVEKYLDYVESIWPYYCRTIRFLKKANLI